MNYLIVAILILFSALFSGLTLGLMSLDSYELKRKKSLGDKDAAKLYPIRKKGNLLLCTLLIGNVGVNSSLAVFLGSITSGIVAGFVATGLIVLLGEITPQAVFSRFSLKLGGKLWWLVRFFMILLFPICWPIAKILDKLLGEEMATIYSKKELMKIVEEHEDSLASDVKEDEERIIKGALTFADKKVSDIMTPRTEVFALPYSQKIDKATLDQVLRSGYSRIPVFKNKLDNIVGILYVKKLIGDKYRNKKIFQASDKKVLFVDESKGLAQVFDSFLDGRDHLFVVTDEFGVLSGVVTIEDVLEEIIGSEIMDETDKYEDLRKHAKQRLKGKKKRTVV
ncbi:hemolysin family protein [Candidatus Parcubacteria bacterium]|nr:hemolysin family protein [Candidatus Parcubacteria bacterium]